MYKWERRALKEKAKRNRMGKSGRSLFLIENIKREKAEKIKKEREQKNLRAENAEIGE